MSLDNGLILAFVFFAVLTVSMVLLLVLCIYEIRYDIKRNFGDKDLEKYEPGKLFVKHWLVCVIGSLAICGLVLFTGMR